MMKRFIAMILCVLLIAGMSVTAFATEIDNAVTGGKQGTVKVQVTDENGDAFVAEATYNVQIDWVGLTFDLVVDDPDTNIVWDGAKYNITGGNWDTDAHFVTVTNKSDAKVAISAAFSNGNKTSEKVHEVAATITNGDKTLASAVNALPESTTYTISLSDAPETLPELSFDVDTITIKVQTAQ